MATHRAQVSHGDSVDGAGGGLCGSNEQGGISATGARHSLWPKFLRVVFGGFVMDLRVLGRIRWLWSINGEPLSSIAWGGSSGTTIGRGAALAM